MSETTGISIKPEHIEGLAKGDVGLGNCDNTSDANKPVSTAQQVAIDSHVTPSAAPATAASTGITGTITWDSDFIYVCIATDTWRRAAIATWA